MSKGNINRVFCLGAFLKNLDQQLKRGFLITSIEVFDRWSMALGGKYCQSKWENLIIYINSDLHIL